MKITKNYTTKAIIPELRGTFGSLRYPCFGEIKYDGEAVVVMYDISWPDRIITTNKYGTMRSEWSKLDSLADILEEKNIKKALFLGELFYKTGEAGALYDLLSHKEDDDLNIKLYDVVHIINDSEMKGSEATLMDRKEILTKLFYNTDFLVTSKIIESKDAALIYFDAMTIIGYEGVVFKPFDGKLITGPCAWVKMKKKDQNDYPVVLIDPTLERIEVKVITVRANMTITEVNVGVKCVNKFKKNLKIGDTVTIEHLGVLDSGSLRNPVFIGKVNEDR